MKKIITSSALAFAVMAGGAHADEVTACLITKTDTNPFFVKMREGATAAAEAAGINLLTYAGAIDGDVEAQVAAAITRAQLAHGRRAVLRGPMLEPRELVGRRHRLGAAERAQVLPTDLHLHVARLADRLLGTRA